jgi:two-component system sensor histidine kinase VicK
MSELPNPLLPTSTAPPNITKETAIFYDSQEMMKTYQQIVRNAKTRISYCEGSTIPSLNVDVLSIKKIITDRYTKDIKFRYITEITKYNLKYCKDLEGIVELRHLEGVKVNFIVTETEYLAIGTSEENRAGSQAIYSIEKALVEQQNNVFETLWNNATPSEQRIKEIEGGDTFGSTEIIQSPQHIQNLFIKTVKSAKKEILLIFPTLNTFFREEQIGIIKLLKEKTTEQNVNVKVLSPINPRIRSILQDILVTPNNGKEENKVGEELEQQPPELVEVKKDQGNQFFEVRSIDVKLGEIVTTVTIVLVDRKNSLVIEKVDDSKKNFVDAIGLAVYSTSKPTVVSYISIFENLWKQVELYQQLKINDKIQKEFINIAAHELRTPTQSILGYAELASTNKELLEHDALGSIDAIYRNAKRLHRLIKDILDVTRIESQTFHFNNERLDLHEVVEAVVLDVQQTITTTTKRKISVIYNNIPEETKVVNKGNIIVEADRQRIAQVLHNLLDNAVKFSKDGDAILVTLEQTNQNDINEAKKQKPSQQSEVTVKVRDQGTGIHPDILPRLFTKFASKSLIGTGLGLYLSKRIIESQGGKISGWNNTNSSGATFEFSLPLADYAISEHSNHN